MTNRPKRELTPDDMSRIAELWRAYNALKELRRHALPPTAKGAWIYEAATIQMGLIADDLEALFAETLDAEMGKER